MTSEDLKTLAMCWLRYDKQYNLVCTEDPIRNGDVVGTDSSQQCRKFVEIETKISIADLRNDLNKRHGSRYVVDGKHERLQKALKKEEQTYINKNQYGIQFGPDKDMVHGVELSDKDHSTLPTQFYFLVTPDILEKSKEIVNQLYPHAGLMVGNNVSSNTIGRGTISVIKTAPVIHKRLISTAIKSQIMSRMVSELCRVRLDAMFERRAKK
jgi:hypothetical protein